MRNFTEIFNDEHIENLRHQLLFSGLTEHEIFMFIQHSKPLYKFLKEERNEFILSKQLIRSGTSIGANIAEAEHAISTKDFIAKLYIALKEAAETKYWLDLLKEADYLTTEEYNSIVIDCEELIKLLTSITKTTNQNNTND